MRGFVGLLALELRRAAAGPLVLTGLVAVVLAVVERIVVAQGRAANEVAEGMDVIATGVLVMLAGFIGQQAFSRERIERIRPWLAVLPIATSARWAATISAYLLVLAACNVLMLAARPSLLLTGPFPFLAVAGTEAGFSVSMASLGLLTRRAYVAWALGAVMFAGILGEALARQDGSGAATAVGALGALSLALLVLSLRVEALGEFEYVPRRAANLGWLALIVVLVLAELAVSYRRLEPTGPFVPSRYNNQFGKEAILVADDNGVHRVPLAGGRPVTVPLRDAYGVWWAPGERDFLALAHPRGVLALLDRLIQPGDRIVRFADSGRVERTSNLPAIASAARALPGGGVVATWPSAPGRIAVGVLGRGPDVSQVLEVEHADQPLLLGVRRGVLVIADGGPRDAPDRRGRAWLVDGDRATPVPYERSAGPDSPSAFIRGIVVRGDVQRALRQGDGPQIVLFAGNEIAAGDPVIRLRPGAVAGTVDVEWGRLDSPERRVVATGIPAPPWDEIVAHRSEGASFDVDFDLGTVVFAVPDGAHARLLAAAASSPVPVELATLEHLPRALDAESLFGADIVTVEVNLGSRIQRYAWGTGPTPGIPIAGDALTSTLVGIVTWRPWGLFLVDAAGVERALYPN